jgi:copper chaperone CopZ
MKGEDMTEVEYTVTGMSCGHCEASVRGEVSKLAGVQDVQVSAAAGTLKIVSTTALADDAVIAAVDEAGYTAVRA